MIRLSAHPVFIAILVAGLMSTPVSYRGGAAEPHPHMFLQLWHDAASGSFTHQAHRPDRQSNHFHGQAIPKEPAPQLELVVGDSPELSVSPFVVADWGMPVLHTPSLTSIVDQQSRRHLDVGRTIVPSGRPAAPEPPPPRITAF
jgi:hypothetical protein